jgi:transposase-like protein
MQDESKSQSMFEIVEQWQLSGKSQSQFSSENGIRLHTLGYWVKKYRESQDTHQGFASLTVMEEAKTHWAHPRIEIELGNGLVVRIY